MSGTGERGGTGAPLSGLGSVGGAEVAHPLFIFAPEPTVTFNLALGETDRQYNLMVTSFDTLGNSTSETIVVNVPEPTSTTVWVTGLLFLSAMARRQKRTGFRRMDG